jgi:hypothetical protein
MVAHAEAPLHEESSSQYLDYLYYNFSIVEKHQRDSYAENNIMRSSSGDLK